MMPGDGLRWQDGNSLWGSHLTTAILNGSVPLSRINDMVTRIVATWYQLGQDHPDRWPPRPPRGNGGPNFSSWTHEEFGLLYPGSNDNTTVRVNRFINPQGKGNESHRLLARKVAAEGTVLVKNTDNILPLGTQGLPVNDTEKKLLKMAVIGEDAGADVDPNGCVDRGCNRGT